MKRIHFLLLGLLVSLTIAAVSPSLPPTRIIAGNSTVVVVTNGVNNFTLTAPSSTNVSLLNGTNVFTGTNTMAELRVNGATFSVNDLGNMAVNSLNSAAYVSGDFVWVEGNSSGVYFGAGQDTVLYRDAISILAQRNSTAAQTFRVYGTYSGAGANYVRASLSSSTTAVTLAAETAGTGADNIDLILRPSGTGKVGIGTASPLASFDLDVTGATTGRIIVNAATTHDAHTQFASGSDASNVILGKNNSTGGALATGGLAYGGVFGTSGARPVQLMTDYLPRLTILSAGNVGIGTTTPTSALQVVGTGLTIGTAGTAVTNYASATATLNFASILAAGSEDLTITVTGAVVNDTVTLGLPATVLAGAIFNAWVSAANTVTVRCNNAGSIAVDPASATYRVGVTSH